MLDWCRNQPEKQEPKQVLMHPPPSAIAMPRLDTTTHHPRLTASSSHNHPKVTHRPKKGITLSSSMHVTSHRGITLSQRSYCNRKAASKQPSPKTMVSNWTQTSRILMKCDHQPQKTSLPNTPQKQEPVNSNHIRWVQPNKMAYLQQSQWSSTKKPTLTDIKMSNGHLLDTNHDIGRYTMHRPAPIIQLQSPVLIPTKKRLNFDPSKQTHQLEFSELGESIKVEQTQEASSEMSPLRPHTSTYSDKYRTLFKNVESEFKVSQTKSQNRIKNTANRKSLFHGPKTIKSQLNSQGDYSVRIEQSIVCENEVRSLFDMIKGKAYPNCKVSIAKEKAIGMLVTLKQVPAQLMSTISEELFVYKELQSQGAHLSFLLELYQTQIEDGVFFFIKEPFNETLTCYMERTHNLGQIERGILKALHQAQKRGLRLKVMPELFDFVMTWRGVKIENGALFGWQGSSIESEQVILSLRHRLLEIVM